MLFLLMSIVSSQGLRRHIIAKHPVQPADGIMVPAELWDDARCRELVGVAFDEILHGPYKADLCRLYVLYRHGGVYTDDDIYLLQTPGLFSLTVVRESPAFKSLESDIGLFNAYIEVPWRHDGHLLHAIRMSTRDLPREKFVPGTKRLWGPTIIHRVLRNATKVVHQEVCNVNSPCSCHVPGVLISHQPCRY